MMKLGDLLEIKHGFAFKGEHFADKGEFVLLTPGNFKEKGGIKLKGDKEKFYSGQFPDEYLLNKGDIVVAMTDLTQNAPILGSSALIPQTGKYLHNQRLGKVINLKTDRALPEFVFYLFNMPFVRGQIKGSATGATVKHTAPSRIYDVSTSLPPLPVQQRIAGILSAYDELIENSQRRIKILESMARAFYREWFVHFRFPGHENHPRVASPLGEIPLGWEVRKLAELCTRMESGGTPKRSTAEYWEGGEIDWYKTGELWDGFLFGSREQITALGQRESTARLFEPGTILMAIYGSPTVGRMGILTRHASCNQAALGFVPNKTLISQIYLYFVLFSLREHFNSLAQGAAQQNISKEKVASAFAVMPTRDILESFDRNAEPVFTQIQALQRQVVNLRRTRDLLLPRLLSGQIEVEVA
jgi:type I restriction enzyme S subunit